MRRRDVLILGLSFGAIAFGILRFLPDAIESTASLCLESAMQPSSSPWIVKLDSAGHPHHCIHRDGHRVAVFAEGWWAYHSEYRYTRPGRARVGPEPAGPFNTLRDAQRFVEAQGFITLCPFGVGDGSSAIPA